MENDQLIKWLLDGDVSIQYQVHRDLLSSERPDLRNRIESEGWGAAFLSKRNPKGHWGKAFYQPKWTSSHYTLMDLRNLCISSDHRLIKKSITKILETCKTDDGGIYPSATKSDVCLNGMFLNYASYFGSDSRQLESVIDALIHEHMPDGGFNCRSNRSGAVHSSFHSTLSVLEGMTEYLKNGYTYRAEELKQIIAASKEFLLLHQLFISDKTGKVINKDFLKLSYPKRWRYDILSALDFFQYSGSPWDKRLQPAIDILFKKRNRNGTWNVQAKHPGATHFDMEKAGKPSRWNTLRALRILKHFEISEKQIIGGRLTKMMHSV